MRLSFFPAPQTVSVRHSKISAPFQRLAIDLEVMVAGAKVDAMVMDVAADAGDSMNIVVTEALELSSIMLM